MAEICSENKRLKKKKRENQCWWFQNWTSEHGWMWYFQSEALLWSIFTTIQMVFFNLKQDPRAVKIENISAIILQGGCRSVTCSRMDMGRKIQQELYYVFLPLWSYHCAFPDSERYKLISCAWPIPFFCQKNNFWARDALRLLPAPFLPFHKVQQSFEASVVYSSLDFCQKVWKWSALPRSLKTKELLGTF